VGGQRVGSGLHDEVSHSWLPLVDQACPHQGAETADGLLHATEADTAGQESVRFQGHAFDAVFTGPSVKVKET